jgi:hypothetical protein
MQDDDMCKPVYVLCVRDALENVENLEPHPLLPHPQAREGGVPLLLVEEDDVGNARLHGLGQQHHTHHAGANDEVLAHMLLSLQQ